MVPSRRSALVGVLVRAGLRVVVAAAAATACHRTPAAPTGPARGADPNAPTTPALSVDALFVAATLRFDGVRVVTNYDADENGQTTSSDSEHHWQVDCMQLPQPSPPGRRVAELTCHTRELEDDDEEEEEGDEEDGDGDAADDAATAEDEDDEANAGPIATKDYGAPFPMELDGYWVATTTGVWHVSDPDEPLVEVERLMSLPPERRSDELPDLEADAERDPPARTVYETSSNDRGAWCHQRIDDPGGGSEASTWGVCLDGRGLVSGSTSDGHGATVWEASVTRR